MSVEFTLLIIEGPLGRAHRRPSIYARHTVAGWRKEACNTRSAIAGGGQDADMHAMYLAGSVRRKYLCEVGSNCCVSARNTLFKKCESRNELRVLKS